MRIVAFKYGATKITERMAFQDGSADVKLPIALLFFMVEYGNKKVLIDVGCNTMPGFELTEFEFPVKVLESYGVKAADITDVIITHAHHDHIDSLKSYSDATVHIQKDELPEAEKYLAKKEKLSVFEEGGNIDDIIEIKRVGGHTKGSSIALIKSPQTTYVFCGDECYTKENLSGCKPTGSSFLIEKSKAFVEEYRKDIYTPVLFHDGELVSEIGYKILYG